MTDPVVETDAVEQNVGGPPAEAAGEHLAVVGQDLLRDAVGVQGLQERVATGRAVARATTLAMPQKRLWSSIPVTTETQMPLVSLTFPMMSSCHSSIARDLSQRL